MKTRMGSNPLEADSSIVHIDLSDPCSTYPVYPQSYEIGMGIQENLLLQHLSGHIIREGAWRIERDILPGNHGQAGSPVIFSKGFRRTVSRDTTAHNDAIVTFLNQVSIL